MSPPMISALFNRIGRVLLNVSAVLNASASIWTFLLMLLMTADVVGREVFNQPVVGAPEIVRASIVGIVFLQLANTLWVDRHVRCMIIVRHLGPRGRACLGLLTYLIGVAVFISIIAGSWDATIVSWDILETEGEGALRVPVYPIRSIILLGSALTVVMCLVRCAQSLLVILKPGPGLPRVMGEGLEPNKS